jgi:hypothetical protein
MSEHSGFPSLEWAEKRIEVGKFLQTKGWWNVSIGETLQIRDVKMSMVRKHCLSGKCHSPNSKSQSSSANRHVTMSPLRSDQWSSFRENPQTSFWVGQFSIADINSHSHFKRFLSQPIEKRIRDDQDDPFKWSRSHVTEKDARPIIDRLWKDDTIPIQTTNFWKRKSTEGIGKDFWNSDNLETFVHRYRQSMSIPLKKLSSPILIGNVISRIR